MLAEAGNNDKSGGDASASNVSAIPGTDEYEDRDPSGAQLHFTYLNVLVLYEIRGEKSGDVQAEEQMCLIVSRFKRFPYLGVKFYYCSLAIGSGKARENESSHG